jgi:hypothetical protein
MFSDDDFVAAVATNREQNPNCQQLHIEPSDHLPEDQPTSAPEVNNLISSDQDSAENRTMLAANDLGQDENISQDRADTDKSQKISEAYSFKQIIAETVTKREIEQQTRKRRQVQHAAIVTSSPYKTLLLEAVAKKSPPRQAEVKQAMKLGCRSRQQYCEPVARTDMADTVSENECGNFNSRKKPRPIRSKKKKQTDDDCECLYCNELFSVTGGNWIQCTDCTKWAHVECAGVSNIQISFQCDICVD